MAFWRSKPDTAPQTTKPGVQRPIDATPAATNAEPGGFLAGLRSGLAKTSRVLHTDIRDLFKGSGRLVDDAFLTELFARLIRTDMGTGPAGRIRDQVGKQFRGRVTEIDEVLAVIETDLKDQLRGDSTWLNRADEGPTVVLVVGVNGSGKTTSIGKLAGYLVGQGNRVVLGAGDTFRAAAVEQLTLWSGRIGCDIVRGTANADPASVAYQTVDRAVNESYDVAIVDTAGRLQTQGKLMQELQKIRRVVEKRLPGAPHEVLLVLDATAGQNAISQAKGFSEAAGCTGIVLAKLDGSAKGGVVLPIRDQFGLPVKFVGTGEGLGDMQSFDPDAFAEALLAG